jgi:enoyl-CoA hydratase
MTPWLESTPACSCASLPCRFPSSRPSTAGRSAETGFGVADAGLGIVAAAGATWRLVELVGEPIAKEILMAGRILTADEALAMHLVSSVHEPANLDAAAHALADRIGKQDALALRFTKMLIHSPRAAHPAVDQAAQAVLFESDQKFARMTAFLEKRKS